MIPETNGTMAVFKREYGTDREPVIAWNDDGIALVVDDQGFLAEARRDPAFQWLVEGNEATPTALIPGGGWIAIQHNGIETPVVAWGVGRDGRVRPYLLGENSIARAVTEDDAPRGLWHPDISVSSAAELTAGDPR